MPPSKTWQPTKVIWQPPKQDRFWRVLKTNHYGVVGYGGARGGGKSFALRNAMLLRRCIYPGTAGYIFRKTYDQLEANHILPLLKEHRGLQAYYKETKHAVFFPNGSTLYFRYLDRPQDAINYQGLELEDIAIDEATQHPESVFDHLRAANRTSQTVHGPDGKRFKPTFMLSFNPGGVGHGWIKRKFIRRQFQEWEDGSEFMFIKALVYDNKKLIDADPNYVRRLESLPPQLRKAFLLGSFDVFEGQYFQEWQAQNADGSPYHVVPYAPPPAHWKRFIAIDWGYDPDSFVALWFAVAPNRRLYVYRELSLLRHTAGQAAKKVVEASGTDKIAYVVCDPSIFTKGRGTTVPSIAEEMVDNGIPTGLMRKADNDRVNGWMLVRKYLSPAPDGLPWMQIMDSCPDLIRTLPDQVHDETRKEDLDTDGDDHWVDTLRYGAMTRPFRKSGGIIQTTGIDPNEILRKAPTINDQGQMENMFSDLIKNDLRNQEPDGDPIRML